MMKVTAEKMSAKPIKLTIKKTPATAPLFFQKLWLEAPEVPLVAWVPSSVAVGSHEPVLGKMRVDFALGRGGRYEDVVVVWAVSSVLDEVVVVRSNGVIEVGIVDVVITGLKEVVVRAVVVGVEVETTVVVGFGVKAVVVEGPVVVVPGWVVVGASVTCGAGLGPGRGPGSLGGARLSC
jgi:hypothetical protein